MLARQLETGKMQLGASTPSPKRSTVSTKLKSSIDEALWRNLEAVEFATLEWVDWFYNRRLLEPIGFIPPAEAEERYFAMLNDKAMAA